MLNNYFKPTSKNLLKVSLALRAMIGTIAGAVYFNNHEQAGFWLLVAGAVIEFFIQCIRPTDITDNGKAVAIVLLVAGSLFLLSGCKSTQPLVHEYHKDTTTITYHPVKMKVEGAQVSSSLDLKALTRPLPKEEGKKQSQSVRLRSPDDSVNWKIMPVIVEDSSSKVQLKYWVDEYGKLTMQCSSKDQTIQMLVAQVNKLSKDVRVETVVKHETKWYTWVFLGWAIAATALIVIAILLKSLRLPG